MPVASHSSAQQREGPVSDDAVTRNTRAVVQRFWEAMDSGDADRVRAYMEQHLAPDMEWSVMGTGVPGAGTLRGRDRALEVIGGVRALFEPGYPRGTVIRMVVEGNWAAAETEATGPMRDGRIYRNRYAFFIEVSGLQIRRLHEYFDTHYVHELMK